MNIWHDLSPERVTAQQFTACIEISKGSKVKYELDKPTGLLKLDRVLYTSTQYPGNYGFIPLTFGEDDDPVDVLVICSEPITTMALVDSRPIGVINMIDSGRVDSKIIAVPSADPFYHNVHDITDLPEHVFAEIEHFFNVYKMLEMNKHTIVTPVQGRDVAVEIIQAGIERYRTVFGKE